MNENQIEIVMQACYAICAIYGAIREFVDVAIEAEKKNPYGKENVERLEKIKEQL